MVTTDLTYLISDLIAGTVYEFKVEARNQYDYSEYSETLVLLCAFIPGVPNLVQTTIESNSVVTVTWNLATDNGSPITSYKIYIREHGKTTYT